jgi:hypothetical protein
MPHSCWYCKHILLTWVPLKITRVQCNKRFNSVTERATCQICSTPVPPCIIGPLVQNFSSHNRLYYQNQGHLLLVPSVYRITGAVIPVKSPHSMHAIHQYIFLVEDKVTGMSHPHNTTHNWSLVHQCVVGSYHSSKYSPQFTWEIILAAS